MLIIHYKFENKRESSATAINLFIILNLRKSKSKHLNKQYCTFFCLLFYGFNVVVVSWKALHCTQGWWHFTTCFLQKKLKKKKIKKQTAWPLQHGCSGVRRQVWTQPLRCQWKVGKWFALEKGGRGEDEEKIIWNQPWCICGWWWRSLTLQCSDMHPSKAANKRVAVLSRHVDILMKSSILNSLIFSWSISHISVAILMYVYSKSLQTWSTNSFWEFCVIRLPHSRI